MAIADEMLSAAAPHYYGFPRGNVPGFHRLLAQSRRWRTASCGGRYASTTGGVRDSVRGVSADDAAVRTSVEVLRAAGSSNRIAPLVGRYTLGAALLSRAPRPSVVAGLS